MKMIELKEFPGYFVTEDGQVFSERTGAFLKGGGGNYLGVLLRRDGKTFRRNRHRLVALTHVHNPDSLLLKEVNHKDGNKHNNRADNLEWCDRSGNMKHAYETGHWGNQYTKRVVV
jgi:hypothetical protein